MDATAPPVPEPPSSPAWLPPPLFPPAPPESAESGQRRARVVLALAGVLVVAAAGAAAALVATSHKTIAPGEVTSNDNRFAVRLPAGWRLDSNKMELAGVTADIVLRGPMTGSFQSNVNVNDNAGRYTTLTEVRDSWDVLTSTLQNDYGATNVSAPTAATVGGEPALEYRSRSRPARFRSQPSR